MKKLVFYILSLLFIDSVFGQADDCSDAINICTNANFQVDPNGFGNIDELEGSISNPNSNPASSNGGCLLQGELNSTWMIINVASSGTLEFTIGTPILGGGCLDWIMWPYTINTCSQILNNQLAPIRCNWNANCQNFTGIATPLPAGGLAGDFEPELNVTAGQQFLLCLSNYSSQTTNLPLNFAGSSSVSCNTVLPVSINSTSICPGQSTTLTATVSGATSYLWSPGGQTTPSITVSPGSTTTYTCTVNGTSPNGGTATGTGTGTVTILSANNPACGCTITASNSGPVCVENIFNLSATSLTNGSYDWMLNGSPIGTTQNINNIPTTNVGSYTFNLTGTDGAGNVCTSTTTVIVNPLPNVFAGAEVDVCLGNSVTLMGSGAITYQWTGGIQNGVSFTPSTNNVYAVTGTDANGCINTDEVGVNMLFAQMPSISPSITLGCVPSTVIFTNNNPLTQNCLWNFGNGVSEIGCNSQTILYNQMGCYDVTLTQTDNQGCDTTVMYNDLICIEDVSAEFYVNPGTIGPGNSTVNFYNLSIGAASYLWSFGDNEGSTEVEPSHTYSTVLQTGYSANLVATSQAGCIDSVSMPIIYEEQLIYYIPNSFTPDSDEHNQLFCPVFTSGFDPFNFEMKIYNRWGELIFESHDSTKGWDGSYGSKGERAQCGVYSWVINFKPKNNDEKIAVNGFVNVLE